MKAIVAEDDPVALRLLQMALGEWGYEVISTTDGRQAWAALLETDGPRVAVLDWMMPGMDGVELCRRIRATDSFDYVHVILLTARDRQDDVVAGLEAGADDYVTKPFDLQELRSRIRVGERVVHLQHTLAARNQALAEAVRKLEDSLVTIRRLHGLLPICAYCRRIRDDHDYWHELEAYIAEHSETEFTHSVCPDCYGKHVRPQLAAITPPGPPSP